VTIAALDALLSALATAAPPVETLTPEQARAAQLRRRQAVGALETEAVAQVTDLTLPGPAGEIPVRVYRPAVDEARPAVVFFHGGGWVLCDLDSHDAMCRQLCNASRTVVISVDYRRAPEDKFPAAVDDAIAAVRWVAENPASVGARPGPLAVAGDSAGGNLAAAVTLALRDEPISIALQALLYPVLAHNFTTESYRRNANGPSVTRAAMQWYWGHYLADATDGQNCLASPLLAKSFTGLPDAFVVVAGRDPLHDEGASYAQRLAAAGAWVTLLDYPDMFHGFAGYQLQVPAARTALAAMAAALADAFHRVTEPL
jgi:acetyl esterase